MKIHTGRKLFGCGLCENKYFQFYDLKLHSRIHPGENLYRCGCCPMTFYDSDMLKYHVKVHRKSIYSDDNKL